MREIAALPEQIWDAIVVGAGPAGSVTATLLAERGWRVLLVERSSWPREKPCGGCVNGHAIATLRRLKLSAVLRRSEPTLTARVYCRAAVMQRGKCGPSDRARGVGSMLGRDRHRTRRDFCFSRECPCFRKRAMSRLER